MSDDQHAAAVIAAINAQLPPAARAYDLDDVPATPPQQYVEVTLSRVFGGNSRLGGGIGTTGWRITTRAVATTVGNARLMRQLTGAALEDVSLAVAGAETTGIEFETEDPIGPDGDAGQWFSGLTTWTYCF